MAADNSAESIGQTRGGTERPPGPGLEAVGPPSGSGKAVPLSFLQLFRYSSAWERVLVVVGLVLASLAAVAVPYSIVIYGEFTSLLVDRTTGAAASSPAFVLSLFGGGSRLTNASREQHLQAVRDDSVAFGLGSLAGALTELVLLALAVDLLNRVALRQIGRVRKLLLEAVLRQDMSWFDTTSGTNFASKLTEDLEKMKEGMGEKVAIFAFLLMTFVMGVVASFFYGWQLTLVVLTCCPFIMMSTAMVAKIQSSLTEKELKAYSAAGAVAEEVFAAIRTVLAFSGERKEAQRFSERLAPAEQTGRRKGLYSGIGAGAMWFLIYCCYAIAMWYGVQLIVADRHDELRRYTPAVLVIVLFGIIMGAQNLGFASPHAEAFAAARGAAQGVFSVIDRRSAIDPLDSRGSRPPQVLGDLSFERVDFRYPARPGVDVLKGFSLRIAAGQTVALVGPSGGGKSTVLQLVQRFYDPSNGAVRLDGRDVRDVNVAWLRSQIGVVGQEPVLFATTVEENIRYGRPDATFADIERAARVANCHDFIVKLPKGYQTVVGERGAAMSGGQKQRIAIARALVRNPRILLLDEATSALDPASEKRVQDALERAGKGRTTLIVSHRLSTITNAHKVVFVKDGAVAEEGTLDELLARGDLYSQLAKTARQREPPEGESGKATEVAAHLSSDDEEVAEDGPVAAAPTPALTSAHTEAEAGAVEGEGGGASSGKERNEVTFCQLMRMNAPEWPYILFGCLAAMTHGSTFPVWAILFGDFFGIMANEDDAYVQSRANVLSCLFVAVGLVAGLSTLTQSYMFAVAGVRMTSRLRKTTFKAILDQEVAYFDDQSNSVGALCARLAGDCSAVQGATGVRIGIIVQALSTLFVGIVLAFVVSWKLTLLTLVTVPFVCLSIFFEGRLMAASALAEKVAIERASQLAVEALANIRTVASLGQEQSVLKRYSDQIDLVDAACVRKLRFRGFVFGLGQASPFLAYGLCLYYGGILVATDSLPYEDIIKVSEALIFGSWMFGQALSYAPNVGGAILSAGRLLKLFKRVPALRSPPEKPQNPSEKSAADVSYENVDFEYPTRRGVAVLQDFNLDVREGTTVALVGSSGSGKSTCVQLLLRYYDPIRGSVNLSGTPIEQLPFDSLRSRLGLVSQEPVLFDRTIAENIAYGNNFRDDVTMAEIVESAKKANIHDFIVSLPQGYETSLGGKGAQLSGGQKQRIAIARALVRNPQVLILDEATSALDMESEKVVQRALDAARSGRTCITIAHRLSTVQDANLICVLKKGIVVEKGTHDELLALNGIYSQMYRMQQVT